MLYFIKPITEEKTTRGVKCVEIAQIKTEVFDVCVVYIPLSAKSDTEDKITEEP